MRNKKFIFLLVVSWCFLFIISNPLLVQSSDSNKSSQSLSIKISPSKKSVKKGAKQKFNVNVAGIKGNSSAYKAKATDIEKDIIWMVNEIQGGNKDVGKINSRGVYRAPKKVPSSNPVYISAYSSKYELHSNKARIAVVSTKKKGVISFKAKWVSGRSARVSNGIPAEVKKVKGVAVNSLTGEKFTAGPVNVEDRVLEFPDVPLEGNYTVTLYGIDDSGKEIYKGTVSDVKATAPGDTTKPVTIILTIVNGEVEVSAIEPAITEIHTGSTQQFTVTISGVFDPEVKWSVSGDGDLGTITKNGLYTAPTTINEAVTATVKAAWKEDGSKFSEISFSIVEDEDIVSISVSPVTATVESEGTVQFDATVTGSADTSVAWSVEGGSSNGTIDSAGLYTAPSVIVTTTVTVKAVSNADPSKYAIALVTVNPVSLPEVLFSNPDNGSTGVAIDTTVQVTFSEAMNSSTINTSTFIVNGITGTVVYFTDSMSAVFTPSAPLSYDMVYTATITAGVENLAGNNMASPYVWFFKTQSPLPAPSPWSWTFSTGLDDDQANSVTATPDGGCVAAGYTVPETNPSEGYFWIANIGSEGTVNWQKTYNPDVNRDEILAIERTTDSGYVLAGYTVSSSVVGSTDDFCVIKINSDGTPEWQKTYGGSSMEQAESIQQTSDGGYIVAGWSYSFSSSSDDIWILKLNSDGSVAWKAKYGEEGITEEATKIIETSDGGYFVVGHTVSSSEISSGYDVWALKLDSDGSISWQEKIGEGANDRAQSVIETSGGEYLIAGYKSSYGGGPTDFWLIKLDLSGNILWQKTYGGTSTDIAEDVRETSDGNFIVAGWTYSFIHDGDSAGWLIKVGSSGDIIWQKTYSLPASTLGERFNSVALSPDGGIIVAGYADTFDADYHDPWVMKLNSEGNLPGVCNIVVADTDVIPLSTTALAVATTVIPSDTSVSIASTSVVDEVGYSLTPISQCIYGGTLTPVDVLWAKTYGGPERDNAKVVRQTSDGGYIVAGNTESGGWWDILLMKLKIDGSIEWQKTFGGTHDDLVYSCEQTSDGGYIVAGTTGFTGTASSEVADIWLFKVDAAGNIEWQKKFGGGSGDSNTEIAQSVHQTSDGGYIVTGGIVVSSGNNDLWVARLDSSGTVLWQKKYGGSNSEWGYSIDETSDGGFIVAGEGSFGSGTEAWILKLNSDGTVAWQKTFGGTNYDLATSVRETSDGAYIVAAYSTSIHSDGDVWILKLNSDGSVAWQNIYDSSLTEYPRSIEQAKDGGYIITGYTFLTSSDINAFVLKLDSAGTVEWGNTYVGPYNELSSSVWQTLEGGYIVAGQTDSTGAGSEDFWILRIDSNGDIGIDCSYVFPQDFVSGVTTLSPVDTIVSPVTVTLAVSSTSITSGTSSLASATQCSAPLIGSLVVYVMSSGDADTDQAVINALVARKHIPVLGPQVGEWDGTQTDIYGYNVVVLQNSYNWSSSGSMPVSGENALIDFVDSGGGLVTGEWLIWNIDSGGRHTGLDPIIPADMVSWNSASSTSYSQYDISDPILNNGLPSSFTFSMNSISGSESNLAAKSGATEYYYSSNSGAAGVVGWDYGSGRVISFSTLLSDVELSNSDYSTLFVNAVEWAGTPAP
ncbi:MAG: Ig-like domain-containing protein [Candidatus Schekmanbacteria bacterium]|nr:Ig-like domain-containing protein [Candidatus Schekmanbacteria bacterium]